MMKNHGLTLLELLVSLAIIGLLASMAIPSFANTIKRSNSLTVAYQLMGLVQFARTEAISKSVPVTICGSSTGSQCNNDWSKTILIFTDINDNGLMDDDDVLLQTTVSLQNGGTLSWRSFRNKPYLQMEPNGMTYFQNGNFTYCPPDHDAHYALHWIINVTGHLRIAQDKNGNGIPENASGQDISCS